MEYKNSSVDGVFLMPREICKHLKVKKSFLAVALYLFSHEGESSVKTISEELSITENDVVSAVAYWCEAGVFDKETSGGGGAKTPVLKTYVTPSYTSSEMASVLEDKDFSSFYKWIEQRIGKVLNSAEQEKLYGLYDAVGIPYDVLSGIVEYCVGKGKKSIRYIERTALSIYDEGVRDFTELQSYFEKTKKKETLYDKAKEVMGAESRALTNREKTYVDKWATFNSSHELIEYAYEITINNISKPSLGYMTKILESWYINGYKTVADVENGEKGSGEIKAEPGKKLSLMDFIETPK